MEERQVNDSFQVNSGRDFDYRKNPWDNVAQAEAAITGDQRQEGMFIPVRLPNGRVYPHEWINNRLIPFVGQINQSDTVLVDGFTLDEPNSKVMLDGTEWRIDDVQWILQNLWEYPIPAADPGGLIRIDRIRLTSSPFPEYMVGVPGVEAVAKPLIEGELGLVDITVSLAGVTAEPAVVNAADLIPPFQQRRNYKKHEPIHIEDDGIYTAVRNFKAGVTIDMADWVLRADISSGGSGSLPVQIFGEVLLSSGWTMNAGYFEYSWSNVNVTVNSIVDFIPHNASIATVKLAEILPLTTSAAGEATIYSTYEPSDDITVNVVITESA